MEYTWQDLIKKYNWNIDIYKDAKERIQYAKARGIIIQELERKSKQQTLKYEILEEFPYYFREQIVEKYNLLISNKTSSLQEFIRYCKKRGVIIEKLGLINSKNSFKIIDDSNYILDGEIWKPVVNTSLTVSNYGRVKSKDGSFKQQRLLQGYCYVTDGITKKNLRVHRLVMLAFNPIKNSQEFDVDHINGIKNDNRLENLRWVSSQRNIEFRDINQNKIGAVVSELIQEYGYEEIYQYLLDYPQKRKPKA